MPFMRFLALILIVAVFCVALIFTYQNKAQTATLTLGSYTTNPIPVFVIILGSFLMGVIFTSVIGVIEGMKLRVTNTRLKRKTKRLQTEVDALRNLPLSGPVDEDTPPEPAVSEEDGAL
jgi:uncharacterized integral membrane protein